MKLIVMKESLQDGLGVVGRISAENTKLPILKNFLFEANNNKITLTTTNLESAIVRTISGKVIQQGSITVPLGPFSSFIGTIQSERLTLEKEKNSLFLKTDTHEAVFHGLPVDEFPIIPKIKETKEYLRIGAEALKDALTKTLAATQPSELRPELNSILFCFTLESLKIAATDSFRLAEKTIPSGAIETNKNNIQKLLIPQKTGHDLLHILKDNEEVNIYSDENQILFKTNHTELTSRLIEGTFPDYEAVVPQKFSLEIVADRQEFLHALKLAGIFGSRTREVKITVLNNKKIMEIASSDQAIGGNTSKLPVRAEGEPGEASFNWRYLAEGLKVIDSQEIFFGVNKEKPGLLKSTTDGSYFYIIAPARP